MDTEDDLDFTDDEIRGELSKLGYDNVPSHRLQEFKRDLKVLIGHEYRKNNSQDTTLSSDRNHNLYDESNPAEETTDYQPYAHEKHRAQRERNWEENRCDMGLPTKKSQQQPIEAGGNFSLYDSTPDTSHVRDDISETDTEKRLVKRKVLRKKEDGSKVIDESVTESDLDSILDLHERLRDVGIDDNYCRDRRPRSAQSVPPYRLPPDDTRPASVILRSTKHPHTKNLRKSDPVARFQQFRQSWEQQKVPGDKAHKSLRWNVREQMLSQDHVTEKKSQRVFVPNKYVVPTDKKRKDLRWQIRMDIAQGQMPAHGFYHEY